MKVDWETVKLACVAGMTYFEASKHFGIKKNTINAYSLRHAWPTPPRIHAARLKRLDSQGIAVTNALLDTWANRGEIHRNTIYSMASKAITGAKMQTVKSWKDAEIADKMARRAAGLDCGDTPNANQTIVNIDFLGVDDNPTFDVRTCLNPEED